MGGMPVRQAFPSSKAENVDPFLLLHHANIKVPTHVSTNKAGVIPHPHRGFSPVTFIFKGGVHHRDSRGNDNVVYEGGTQWMHAGMGVVHSERPPEEIFKIGGQQELIQLWVNSPASNRMDQPIYFPLTSDDTPQIISEDGLVKIKNHSGELNGAKGLIPSFTAVNTFTVEATKGGKYFFEVPASHNAFIYVLKGNVKIAEEPDEIEGHYAVILNNDGDGFTLEGLENSIVMTGTGEPLNEPIASHGPFVMNNQTKVMAAFREYQMGKMGVLIED